MNLRNVKNLLIIDKAKQIIAGLLFALRYIVATVVAGALTLTAAVADVFGFNSNTVKSDAESEGKKQDKGVLGKLYDKFKGWF